MGDAAPGVSLRLEQAVHSFTRSRETGEASKMAGGSVKGGEAAQLKKACVELESLFIYHLLKEMRASMPRGGFLTGGRGEAVYTSMFDAQVARELASQQGIGLSALLEEHLDRSSGSESDPDGKKAENVKVSGVDNR